MDINSFSCMQWMLHDATRHEDLFEPSLDVAWYASTAEESLRSTHNYMFFKFCYVVDYVTGGGAPSVELAEEFRRQFAFLVRHVDSEFMPNVNK